MLLTIIDLKHMSYSDVLLIQRKLQKLRIQNNIGDVLLMVEHDAVLTMGTRGKMSNVIAPEEVLKENGIEIAWVERGGDVTYHGPGQIVGYPIINLENFNKDLRAYIGRLQQTIIDVLQSKYNISAQKKTGVETGVWIDDEKIAAIGIHVTKWVSMHGFAFNVNTDMSHFNMIVPCGLDSAGVTSVEKITGQKQDFEMLTRKIEDSFSSVFEYDEITRISIVEFLKANNIDLDNKELMDGKSS